MAELHQDHAGRVFLLMGKEYRISRSIRAQWFFQHINSAVHPKSNQDLISSHEELEVLSVLPEVSNIRNVHSFRLAPSTRITFIGRQYRFVFCLDISSSQWSVNVENGKILLEEVFENFMNCILGLIEPFSVPGSSLVLEPELVITVLAYTPLAHRTCQVLVQGLSVSRTNIYSLLCEVKCKLQSLEDILAKELSRKYDQELPVEADAIDDEVGHDTDSSLFNMVRDALLALQLLPDNASAGLVIVTDGVFNLSDASAVDAVLAQMRASTVVCSFLQVGGGSKYGYGFIPHTSLMQFIATATSGAYMCACPRVNSADPKQHPTSSEIQEAQPMNVYHEALLCWNFHTDIDRGKIAYDDVANKLWMRKMPFTKDKIDSISQPMQKIKHSECKHSTRISSVLSVRLREGYSIESVAISRDGTQLEVKLTLPWKEHVLLEYIAKAAWPIDQSNRSTHVDVFIKGSYDFLVDITSKQKFTSSYRKTVVYKFEQTMKSLQATDELLVRLQSFSINPAYTTIPDSAKDGVPLFHLPQSSRTPVLSLQQGKSKKSAKSQEALFAEYWKPILHLDTKTWQKWFHCHRVSILLENDRPISKNLFIPSVSERYHTVHCRTAMNALNRFLRDWSSFVLLENHSYIRFLGSKSQKTPYSFCLLRLVFKGLCVVIRLAFLGGTAGTERHKIVSELKESLDAIRAPLKKPLFSPERKLSLESPSKSIVLTTKEKRCVIFLEKPLERILVKYESIPDDLRSAEYKGRGHASVLDVTESSSRLTPVIVPGGIGPERSNPILGALSRYTYNQRWVWKMSCQTKALPIGAVAAILYALTKRRLLEGFHFCSSNQNGIITMVKEVPMELPAVCPTADKNVCVLQFVLFPPHRCMQLKEGFQNESVESDAFRDGKGDLQIATEIWVEPHCGVVESAGRALQYIDGMKYNEIPEQIFCQDLQTVKEMVTYSHLESMCIDSLLTTIPPPPDAEVKPPSEWFANSTVVDVPFLFDIVPLLAKSKQVCLLLPLLKSAENEMEFCEQRPNDTLLSLFFSSLLESVDCEVPFTDANCAAFSSFVANRCNEKQSVGYRKSLQLNIEFSSKPLWRCYAGASRRSIIMLVVPATLSDVEKINLKGIFEPTFATDKVEVKGREDQFPASVTSGGEEEEKTGMNDNDRPGEEDSVRELRESVDDEDASDPWLSKARPYFPVFLYECRFATISDVRSKPGEEDNIFVDYRSKLSDSSHEEKDYRHYSGDVVDVLIKSAELTAFCRSLSDRYFQTFVNGVFKNLQLGFAINNKDVESSVELICEESCIEVDITSFIRIICKHFRNQKIEEEVFDCLSEGNVIIRRGGKLSSGSTSKTTPRTPVMTTPKCGSENVHKFVQDSFLEILRTKFSNVPQNAELFYYNASDDQSNGRDSDSVSDADSEIQEGEMQEAELQASSDVYGSSEQLPSSAKEEDAKINTDREDNISQLSRLSLKGSTSTLSAFESADAFSEPGSAMDRASEDDPCTHPLFLHLMCSLRDRNLAGSEMGLLPVDTLPTCLSEIIRMLEEGGNHIDPFSSTLKVTLDLICLTLPPESESGKCWKVIDETASTRAESEADDEFLVDEHGSIAEDEMKQGVFELSDEKGVLTSAAREKASTLIDHALMDPLKTLPKAQLNAFKIIVKKIEWLLKDEIASALINTSPVIEATLDNVADHVKNSSTDNCQFRRISLRFVCGLDKSLQLFMSELSRAKINDYRFLNKGKYFYLAADDLNEKYVRKADTNERTDLDIKELQTSKCISPELCLNREENSQYDVDDVTRTLDSNEVEKGFEEKSEFLDYVASNGEDCANEDNELLADTETVSKCGQLTSGSFESKKDELALCKEILLEIVDSVVKGLDREAKTIEDTLRSRSGSLPLPGRDNTEIIRRRYSDTKISYEKDNELTLNLQDTSTDLSAFHKDYSFQKTGPDFWLFASVHGSEVIVYHHKRREAVDSGDVQSEKCYIDLLGMIDKIGRLVNQQMLLDDLHETFTCHNLLVAEEDEHIWSRRETSPAKQLFVSATSEIDMSFEFSKVVHGEFEFHPGYFECDKVWETFLPVHYRLKSSPGQPKGTSKAIQAVRSVLERFAVLNRSNLFVYRESTNNVFYFRIHETMLESEPLSQLANPTRNADVDDPIKEDNLSYNSAASSSWSLAGKMQLEEKQEVQEDLELKEADIKTQRTNSVVADSVSELSFASIMTVQKIQFCVHGINEPGSEIKDELVRVLRNKLDDAVFEQLNLLIARNPKCRLAPADVQFIQPPGHAPDVIHIALPKMTFQYTHSFVYFLRQYLLQRFHTPRFTEANPEFHFKNYGDKNSCLGFSESLPINDVYLYNRRETKGRCIGCIYLSVVDADHNPLSVYPTSHKARVDVFEPEFYSHSLEDFIKIKAASARSPEDELLLEFKVWHRGSINVDELMGLIVSDVQKALCDIFFEYFILFTPVSEIPTHLQSFYFPKSPSIHSQATTPTFVKSDSRSATPVSSTPFARTSGKKFLSETSTPSDFRARSPAVLRNRSLQDISVKEPLVKKASKESLRDSAKKSQIEGVDNIEKTYETLEEFFPLNPPGNRSRESPTSIKSDNEDTGTRKVLNASNQGQASVSVQEVEKLLPKISGSDNPIGSPYDTLTDREVEESFNATQSDVDDTVKEAGDRRELTWKEIERRKRLDNEARKARRHFERGETGYLHPCYLRGIDLVLEEMLNQGAASIHKHTGSVNFDITPELVLKEMLKILVDIASDIKPKVFKQSYSPSVIEPKVKRDVVFIPHSFERSAVKSDDFGESSTDATSLVRPASIVPGTKASFIAIGRNVKQWRKCISLNEAVSDEEEKGISNTSFSKQQFKPFVSDGTASYSGGRFMDNLAPSCMKPGFVPRQKFYIVKFVNRTVVIFTYNFPVEVNSLLDKQLNRLYAWHNARYHLASCLAMQKLGLFHHLQFSQEGQDEETASFCSSTNHVHITSLLKETVPVSREKSKGISTDQEKSLGWKLPSLDDTFRDTAPCKPLHKENFRLSADPVKRIGHQYQEVTKMKINVESQQAKLRESLEMWHNCGPHLPIYENRLSLLKRHSHFIHFCQTPMLFIKGSKSSGSRPRPSGNMETTKQKEEATHDSKVAVAVKDSNTREQGHDWYGELKWSVMQKYIHYLQTLGFCLIQLQSSNKSQNLRIAKGSFKRIPPKAGVENSTRTRPNVNYLQKSSNAGILILELSCRNDNLSLKMYSFEASRVKSLERFVTMPERWIFQEECSKYKELMHIHSFAYDFQLRQAQQFLSGRNMIFYPGYPVQKLFERMIEIFPTPPPFSCCYLAQGTVSIPCSAGVETKEVFSYLSINAERYKMDPAKITRIDDSANKEEAITDQTILSYMYYTSKSKDKGEFQKLTSGFRRDSADFDGNVIITLSPSQDKEVLNLKFFLVLTNRRELYPRRSLRSQLSSLRSRRKRTFSGSERSTLAQNSDDTQASGPKLRVRFSTRTSSHSFTEYEEPSQSGPLKVPTWPGSLNEGDSNSPNAISSPSSDTALLTATHQYEFPNAFQQQMPRSTSCEPFIPRSNSNEAISAAAPVQINIRKSSSSGQLAESNEQAESNFLINEVAFVSGRLSKVACTCLSNCWRDFMWYQLLLMDCFDDETSAKKHKKKMETRKESGDTAISQWKLSAVLQQIRKDIVPNISVSEIKLLLGLVKLYSLSSIDKRVDTILTLLGNSKPHKHGLARTLSGKFGTAYREFLSEDSRVRYICLLNPKDLDMFVLVTTGTDDLIQNIQAVYREEPRFPPSRASSIGELKDTERFAVEHIESVTSCLCFCIWNQLLPNQ